MNKFRLSLSLLVFSIITSIGLTLLVVDVSASGTDSRIVFEVTPTGPIDPGSRYEVKATAYLSNNSPCRNCQISWSFADDPQPGDELLPHGTSTDDKGMAKVTVVSYAPNRKLTAMIKLVSDESLITGETDLPYNDKPLMAFMKLVSSYVGKGYILPPLGNVLAKATKQAYIGNDIREVYLEWNMPLGTRWTEIYAFNYETTKVDPVYDPTHGSSNKKTYFVKTTRDEKTSIQIPAFSDYGIRVRACTANEICVDAHPLKVPKLTNAVDSSIETTAIPDFGLSGPYENYQKQMDEEQNLLLDFFGPIMNWLRSIYKLVITYLPSQRPNLS